MKNHESYPCFAILNDLNNKKNKQFIRGGMEDKALIFK
jgi:hypothetical protein